MKTVYDWSFYCTESVMCEVVLFDNDIGEEVYTGSLAGVPDKYLDYEVQSFDPVYDEYSKLCLNIGK